MVWPDFRQNKESDGSISGNKQARKQGFQLQNWGKKGGNEAGEGLISIHSASYHPGIGQKNKQDIKINGPKGNQDAGDWSFAIQGRRPKEDLMSSWY
jgi:hypothetical protein